MGVRYGAVAGQGGRRGRARPVVPIVRIEERETARPAADEMFGAAVGEVRSSLASPDFAAHDGVIQCHPSTVVGSRLVLILALSLVR